MALVVTEARPRSLSPPPAASKCPRRRDLTEVLVPPLADAPVHLESILEEEDAESEGVEPLTQDIAEDLLENSAVEGEADPPPPPLPPRRTRIQPQHSVLPY